jgi:hypothetical protein
MLIVYRKKFSVLRKSFRVVYTTFKRDLIDDYFVLFFTAGKFHLNKGEKPNNRKISQGKFKIRVKNS